MIREAWSIACLRSALALGLVCLVSPFASAQTGATRVALPSPWLPGYGAAIRGLEFEYHSPLPDARNSLLVRSEDASLGVEWETARVPADFTDDAAIFVMLAGIDATDDRREFVLAINGQPHVRFESPATAELGTLNWVGEGGVRAEFRVTLVDRYADSMGYLLLHVPRDLLTPGEPLRLSVTGESAGSRTWFMVFAHEITPGISVRGNPAIVRTPNGPKQTVRVDALYLGDRSLLHMEGPGVAAEALLDFGLTRLELEVPAAGSPTPVPLTFELDGRRYETELRIEPVPALDLYLIHHTHLDIGYTHVQDEVERLQWAHLEEAIELGRASEEAPEEARFVWHPEGSWAVESYLATRIASKRQALLEAIRRGWIHIDGLYANLLTGLATGEALVRTVRPSVEITGEAGVPLESAMFSDIPGMTWGVVPALAQAGVRYLSIGPNRGHRIGSFLDTWADSPFWWESPSGRERLLTWVHGGGYSIFHTGLGYEHLEKRLDEELVLAYADTLAARGWPHGIAGLRYNIGSDNGPPDSTLSAAVAAWNERHVTPRLVISSVPELFRELEVRAGEVLPVFRGDLTGYWEDGAASSARETAMARRAAESLVQTEALAALTGVLLPEPELEAAWRDVLLFLEHTWGSWNSISEPEAEFTVSQWERKKAFAEDAADQARRLRQRALGSGTGADAPPGPRSLEILNSSPWDREEVLVLPPDRADYIGSLRTGTGTDVATQRLADGSLAIASGAVPGWGSRRFEVRARGDGDEPRPAAVEGGGAELDNGRVRLGFDPESGDLVSLVMHEDGRELVPPGESMGDWLYVPGRDPSTSQTAGGGAVRITDDGPLVWTAVVTREAPGTAAGLETRFRVFAGSERVEILHRFKKKSVLEPEAVLLRFPLAAERSEIVVGGAWGPWQAESDQLPGANRNYATMERWADLHDEAGGLQLVSVDVPGIQLGSIGTDATVAGWRDSVDSAPVLYSYVMNNYWETNYRAAQDGPHELAYTLRPHSGFDRAAAERFAIEVAHPLAAREVEANSPAAAVPFQFLAERSIVTLLRALPEERYLVRIYNPSDEGEEVRFIHAGDAPVSSAVRTDPWGEPLPPGSPSSAPGTGSRLELSPLEVATFLVAP
jgi:hypothetical protein